MVGVDVRTTVGLWNVTTRTELATLKGHTDDIREMAFSPDSKTLVTTAKTRPTCGMWYTNSGNDPGGTHGIVYSVAFAPDGRTVATGSQTRRRACGIYSPEKHWASSRGPRVISVT
jgi:WD40 repeat protein